MKRLRHCGGEAVTLESGERGAKDSFGAAQLTEELAGHAGAEAGELAQAPPIPSSWRSPLRG